MNTTKLKADLHAALFFLLLLLIAAVANGEATFKILSMMGWWG